MAGADETAAQASGRRLVYRHALPTRITHWLWALCLFFLLLSGLQIFNAHPALYLGDQSGFAFDNAVLRIGTANNGTELVGITQVLGRNFDTTGWLGLSATESGQLAQQAFPPWATIPSYRDLATGRVVHFFFAWLLVFTMIGWLAASLWNGHLRREILPGARDLKALPSDVASHARLRFRHRRSYGPLQKLSYAIVLLILIPLMIATGLAMSPGFNAAAPWLPELLGGRQTARTLHFAVMVLLVLFFIVHIVMVVLAGPINELRSMVTGRYRVDDARSERETPP